MIKVPKEFGKAEVLEALAINLEKIAICSFLRLLVSLALISAVNGAAGQVTSIDTGHSRLLIHVSKSGVFSGFADNHEVEARIAEGRLDPNSGDLRLSVDSRQMKVLDPQLPGTNDNRWKSACLVLRFSIPIVSQ